VTLSRVLAPFMPFLTEEIYQNLVRSADPSAPESVHLTRYPVPSEGKDEGLAIEMELARAVVGLGRAARSEAGIGVRQPLSTLTVAGELGGVTLSDEVRLEVEEELNIKSVKFATGVEGLARRIAKPNPRVLGPKLGPKFPEVNRALQAGEYEIRADGTVAVGDQILNADEVTISLEPLENQTLVQNTIGGARADGEEDGRSVGWRAALAASLDREVGGDLRAEGLARDVIRRVQLLRREAGLRVGEPVILGLEVPAELREAISAHLDRIQKEVGATTLADRVTAEACVWRGDLDGYPVSLSVEPVN
jgi:isoleucyl-tRNA synthetase